jgi:exopolyphosphatase/pppGpp-phosphohydrolase
MRRAKNKDEIIQRIEKEVGFTVENSAQEQEAELFFLAVMKDKEYAVIDVGGGSVQILPGTQRHCLHDGSCEIATAQSKEKRTYPQAQNKKNKLVKNIQCSNYEGNKN